MAELFDVLRYGGSLDVGGLPGYVDPGDTYANNAETVISFQHVPTQRSVYFKAFITAFNETYSSEWSSESVFGRVDPIYMFKQTQRKITLAFKIPAATSGEALDNLAKVSQVVQYLYPTYMDVDQANTIAQSPLIRLKVMNLLRKNENITAAEEVGVSDIYAMYNSSKDPANGLLGIIESFTVNHNLESEDGVVEHSGNTVLPKLLDVNLTFAPIHETPLGWNIDNEFGTSDFPYGCLDQWGMETQALADEYLATREDLEVGPYGGDDWSVPDHILDNVEAASEDALEGKD
jgi:hypothetical protein